MRKILLASVAVLAVTSGAYAADLPGRGPAIAPAPVYAAPVFTWTGFYLGVNAGAGFNGGNRGFTAAGVGAPLAFYGTGIGNGNNDTSFTGGGQAGFNWQTGAFVWGLEADINYIDRNRNGTAVVVPAGAAFPYAVVNGGANGSNWFGTVRGRLGFAVNRALFYATGGFAYAGNNGNNAAVTVFSAPGTACALGCGAVGASNNNSNIGWALGGGLEYAFTDSISAKIEYLHVELGNKNGNFSVAAFPAAVVTARNPAHFDVVRAGLNFRFGAFSQAAPVVARY